MNEDTVISLPIVISFLWMYYYTRYACKSPSSNHPMFQKIISLTINLVALESLILLQELHILTYPLFLHGFSILEILSIALVADIYHHISPIKSTLRYILYALIIILLVATWPNFWFSEYALFLPILFLLTFSGLFFLFSQKHKDPVLRRICLHLSSGTIIHTMSLLLIILPDSYHYFNLILFSVFCIYSHYAFCSIINHFFTIKKIKNLIHFISSITSTFLLYISTFLIIIFLVFLLPDKAFTHPLPSLSTLLFFYLLLLTIPVNAFFKKSFSFYFPDIQDFKKRINDCENHLNKIFKFNELIPFLSGIFSEFFQGNHLTIYLFTSTPSSTCRKITNNADIVFRENDQIQGIIEYFERPHSIQSPSQTEESLKWFHSLSDPNKTNNIIRIETVTHMCLLTFQTAKKLSQEKIQHLEKNCQKIGTCINNVLLYEKRKHLIFEKVKNTEEQLNLEELKTENLELQKSYQQIQKLQQDLAIKERQAALIKISISMDDEISTPLSNLTMAIQYHLEKIKKNKHTLENRVQLLDIIISQSLRIKSILDELRKVSENNSISKNLNDVSFPRP